MRRYLDEVEKSEEPRVGRDQLLLFQPQRHQIDQRRRRAGMRDKAGAAGCGGGDETLAVIRLRARQMRRQIRSLKCR